MVTVNDYIDEHFDSSIERLVRWCKQPSVSTEDYGVKEMAALAAEELESLGYAVETFPTAGQPVIVAELGPKGMPTILIYDHYDVQPVGDPALWSSPAFQPEVRDGKMYGRGVSDTKGNIVSRLEAIEAYRSVHGTLPVRIVWLLEGEEEIGSPNLDPFINANKEKLAADGCIWEFGSYTWEGTPNIFLGLKGMLSIELISRGANRDLHSAGAAFIASPVWRLVWALNAIKSPDERINIPDFYKDISVPTAAQAALVHSIPDETQRDLESFGLHGYLNGMSGSAVYHASSFTPTANIQGIVAGYTGPGSKTILPNEACAKIDFRLVPDQDPEAIFQSLQRFLRDHGFEDVEVQRIPNEGDLLPAISDPSTPFIRSVVQACREVSGKEPVVIPSSAGSGPMSPFTAAKPGGLGLPTAAFGMGYPDSRSHAPDENIRLADMKAHMKTVARLIDLLGQTAL
ncbi:MAG: M20/M25/M40 family metallo-hydrolase [Chloroflexota bacterium]|nr:M20/M25/M40 family metallo-hydrolase [Chloroflexota bacterium]